MANTQLLNMVQLAYQVLAAAAAELAEAVKSPTEHAPAVIQAQRVVATAGHAYGTCAAPLEQPIQRLDGQEGSRVQAGSLACAQPALGGVGHG